MPDSRSDVYVEPIDSTIVLLNTAAPESGSSHAAKSSCQRRHFFWRGRVRVWYTPSSVFADVHLQVHYVFASSFFIGNCHFEFFSESHCF